MIIYLDIETLDFFSDSHIKALPRAEQLEAMRFGCAVTALDYGDGMEWQEWTSGHELCAALRLIAPSLSIVGWDIDAFDVPIIRHSSNAVDEWTPQTIDLFDLIRKATGRWYSLEAIAQANLGRGKLADGQKAAEWLRSGDPELIAKAMGYCRYDVQLTIDLHKLLLAGKPLTLPVRPERREEDEGLFWLDGRTSWMPVGWEVDYRLRADGTLERRTRRLDK